MNCDSLGAQSLPVMLISTVSIKSVTVGAASSGSMAIWSAQVHGVCDDMNSPFIGSYISCKPIALVMSYLSAASGWFTNQS